MILYSIIMFIAAAPMGWISFCIYQGKTNLIHEYHQTKVVDKAAYGKAFGKAMFIVTMALLLSGIVGLLGNSEIISMIEVTILFIGLIIGIICIVVVQMKYNKGLF